MLLWCILFLAMASLSACHKSSSDETTAAQTGQISRDTFLNDKQTVVDAAAAPITSNMTGTARVVVDNDANTINATLALKNVTGTVTAVHIHDGDIGANGGVVVSLSETASGSGVWTVSSALPASFDRERFKAAGYYLNVHTTANPGGEIRGQLMSYEENIQPIFDAKCVECHRAGGSAGSGGLAINTELLLSTGDSYGSLVNRPATQSTGDIRVIPLDGELSVLYARIAGTLGFSGLAQMPKLGTPLAVRDQNLIKTWIDMGALNKDGVPAPLQYAAFTRSANLSGSQIPVTTSATGTAQFTLDITSRRVTGTLVTHNIAGSAAHIHDGDINSTGGVVVGLSETAAGSGIWTAPATALTPTQRDRFRKAGLYVNVHTTANPNGEIRGQLMSYSGNVQAIFDKNCINCHEPGSPSEFTGLWLTSDYSYTRLVNQPATQPTITSVPTGTRVIPGDATNSMLYTRDSGAGLPAGVTKMPPGGPYLTDRDIEIIKLWINSGAPND